MCTAAEGKDAGRRIYVMGRNLMEHRKYITAIWHILAASVPAFLLVLAVLWDPLYTFDSLLCDHLYTRLGRVGKDIKIIAVDEETLDAYGNYNLWSREKMAELVETLYADETATPALLAFDFLFTGDAEKQTDDRLADACKKHDNLIAASSLVYRGVTKQTEEGEIYYDVWNIDLVEEPYAALSGAVRSGFTNAYIAEDGCVRYTKLMEQFEGQELPSFAWLIYDTYEKQNGRQSVMPGTTGNGQVTFFYSGQVGEFPHFSLRDVLDGTIPTSEFKDCIVLIGAYAPGFQDAYVAAADRGNPMYGVEIQANIVRALQQGKTAVPLPVWIYLIPSGILLYLFFEVAKNRNCFRLLRRRRCSWRCTCLRAGCLRAAVIPSPRFIFWGSLQPESSTLSSGNMSQRESAERECFPPLKNTLPLRWWTSWQRMTTLRQGSAERSDRWPFCLWISEDLLPCQKA